VNLLSLVEGVSSWAELETRIIGLSLEQERGDAFEQFCPAFFILDPVFQFGKVYRHNDYPAIFKAEAWILKNFIVGPQGVSF